MRLYLLSATLLATMGALAQNNAEETYSIDLGYSMGARSYTSLGEGRNNAAVLLSSDKNISQYNGCHVTEIGFVIGCLEDGSNAPEQEITVFVMKALGDEPVAEGRATVSGEPGEWRFISLDTPYEIAGEEGFYVGYSYESSGYQGIVGDGMYPWPGVGDLVALGSVFDDLEWGSGEGTGALCISARIVGEAVPHDQLSFNSSDFPYHVVPGEDFQCALGLYNTGVNEIRNLKVSVKVGDGEPFEEEVTPTAPLVSQGMGTMVLSLSTTEVGNIPVSIEILSVNDGKPDLTQSSTTATATVLSLEEGYSRTVLFEEGTGTWCGYCPRGIVGMAWMKEHYADGSFIPVSIHMSNFMPDPMDVVNPFADAETAAEYCYNPMKNHIFAAPSGYVNRFYNSNASINPEAAILEETYLKWQSIPALANISGEGEWTNETKTSLRLKTSVEFCLDQKDTDYRVGYIVTEDNVGAYMQTNYYAGGNMGEMDGWEDKPEHVEWWYDDVARNCSHPYGFEGSIPSSITAGSAYTYEMDVDLTDVDNIENMHLIAVLVNNLTEVVENACYITDFKSTTAVSEISDENVGNILYFNMQGLPLSAPVKGQVVIRKTGSKVEKVIM